MSNALFSSLAPHLRCHTVVASRGDIALLSNADLSTPGAPWSLHNIWSNGHVGIVRSVLWDEEVNICFLFKTRQPSLTSHRITCSLQVAKTLKLGLGQPCHWEVKATMIRWTLSEGDSELANSVHTTEKKQCAPMATCFLQSSEEEIYFPIQKSLNTESKISSTSIRPDTFPTS